MLLVVPVFLLVVLVHADGWVSAGSCTIPAGSCTIPTGSYSFMMLDWFLLDYHNKVAYLEKGKGWEAYEQILDFLNRSHIRYTLTHRPPIVFDSLVKQLWATATVRTLKAGPSEIIATIDGNEVVVTESLIRTQLQLNDVNGLYEFTLHDTSFQEDISEGGGDYVSSPKSNEALPTIAATTAGGAEDSVALTDLSLKLDRCITSVTTLENVLGVTKKVLGGAVLKLVSRVKQLEGLLQQRKRRLVLSDSKGKEAATKEQDIDLDALHRLASTSLGGDSTVEAAYIIYKASQDAHASSDVGHAADKVPDDTMLFRHTIPAVDGIPADTQTIHAGSTPIPSSRGVSAGSSMDPGGQAAAVAPSSTIPAAEKGIAPLVDDSLPVDLLTEQEQILNNLYDYQLGEDLAKKLHAEQEAEFARQQEELAQKTQAKSVASPTEQGTGLSAQRRRDLDVAQLIYTEADLLELMAKIATNSALSKQLLGDDVNEDNMNERLGMLLMRKRRELAEQSRAKPMNKKQQRDFMRDFVKNQSASVYNQGWTMKQVKALSLAQLKHEFEYIQRTLERSNLLNFKRTIFRPTPTLEAPFAKRARQGVPQDVHAASSQVSASVSAALSTVDDVSVPAAPSIAANVSVSAAPSVHADTEVYADESRLDDPQTATEHISTKHTVNESTPSSSHTHRKQIAKKRVTPIVDVADDALIKFDSASDSDDLGNGSFSIGWHLYPRAQVHVLETVDGWVIYMFVDVSYPLSAATLKRMLQHGLEVPKLLVGGDLTMAKQLVSFIKAALLNAQSAV
nr:xylulose kinase-1 [Tanacetum cinerariifolium]